VVTLPVLALPTPTVLVAGSLWLFQVESVSSFLALTILVTVPAPLSSV